jgi:hypothetical protein
MSLRRSTRWGNELRARQNRQFDQACIKPGVPKALLSTNTCATCKHSLDEPFSTGPCENCVDYKNWRA